MRIKEISFSQCGIEDKKITFLITKWKKNVFQV